MAKRKSELNWLSITIIVILIAGLIAVTLAIRQNTGYQQHASQYNDLNSAADITDTINADGTMGPASYLGNFSNTLPDAYLGKLNFQVTDPSQGKRPTEVAATVTVPANTLPTQGNEQDASNSGGPQTAKSLVLSINKVEVHLARLALPGQRLGKPSITPQPGRPTTTPGQGRSNITPPSRGGTNQTIDNWETLNIGGPQTVDLVQLANSRSFASLGLTNLAGGLYTEVRLYISKATAVLSDGTSVTLTIPGRANIVRIVEPFIIVSGKTTILSMDFDAQNSVIKTGNLYLLKPVVAHFNQQNQN